VLGAIAIALPGRWPHLERFETRLLRAASQFEHTVGQLMKSDAQTRLDLAKDIKRNCAQYGGTHGNTEKCLFANFKEGKTLREASVPCPRDKWDRLFHHPPKHAVKKGPKKWELYCGSDLAELLSTRVAAPPPPPSPLPAAAARRRSSSRASMPQRLC
jgi:hypothetical protein